MTDIVITKKSGDCSDDSLQYMHFPSGNNTSGACTPPGCPTNLYTWKQVYLFEDCDTITIRNFSSIDFEMCSPAGDFPIPELRDVENILVKAEGNRLVIPVAWTIRDEECSIHSGACVKTVQEQLCFFLNTFQPNSIEDSYIISIDGITRWGTVRKITFNKSQTTPITYDARLEFIAGNVVAGEA